MGLLKLLEDKVAQYQGANEKEKDVLIWLNNKAREIITNTSEHLKYVSHVFEEFDIHDVEHSEGVLNIMENLLGNKAKDLSSYDIFSLIAVSYLHDCGMAVSDNEMEIMKMIEGKLDGQKPIAMATAKQMITDNLDTIYHDKRRFNGEIQKWLFVPVEEETLIHYYAELLIGYQNFRNGKIDKIKASDDLDKSNKDLRIEYLRITHHERVEKYLINWGETKFADFPVIGMGQRLANNIAKCCRAHGEDAEYMTNELKNATRIMYFGSERSNLQFVAMMLRLGDIIHFSYDRAHPVLRALHHFKSDYSYQQWHIKSNGLSFNVSGNSVSCGAFCQSPNDYYDLWTYVDYIDKELKLYNGLASRDDWGDYPKCFNEKVDRSNISHAPNFTPALGHKFSLDQNKVLELLTGAKLYPNEYACVRELYQNSLDACRCQIAKDDAAGRPSKGYIEFGLGEEKRNGLNRKYVYCLDNGKGMTKNIIENYLLHIGASYYKSSDFFKKQAETGATFTPTSQFGIGMLSCFMIGDEIEVTTHEEGSEEGVISCVMEGPNEYFYYQSPKSEDAEKVKNPSGTLVKVYLNEKYQKLLNDDPLEELGYLLWCDSRDESIEHDKGRWKHHLYRIMNNFIIVVPDGIDVNIELQNLEGGKESIKIYNKPLPVIAELRPFANINNKIKDDDIKSDFEKFKDMEYKVIQVREKGLESRIVIELTEDERWAMDVNVNVKNKCCVDGIGISMLEYDESVIYELHSVGTLNFVGENRPQLSVSREKIIGSSLSDYDNDAMALLQKLIKESIKEVCAYIRGKNILPDNSLYHTIWEKLFYKFSFCYPILYQFLKEHTYCHDMQLPLIKKEMSFVNFLIADETMIDKDMLNTGISLFFLLRSLESESIEVKDENILMAKDHVGIPAFVSDFKEFDYDHLCLHPFGYNNFWKEYDFVPFGIVRFISDNLWQNLRYYLKDKADEIDYVLTDSWIYSSELFDFTSILSDFNDEINTRRRVNSLCDSFGFDLVQEISCRFYKKPNSYHQQYFLGLTTYTQDYSVLAVGEPESVDWICFAKRGKCSRQELLDSITGERREKIKNVLFLDGKVLTPHPI